MKAKQRPMLRLLPLVLAGCFGLVSANPTGQNVVNGQATFQQQGNVFTITNTPGTIINWQNFSVGAGEVTRFVQQGADSAVLNRVIGQDPSQILGALQSNGRVFVINPNGILFGKSAQVDVNGLVASSLQISDQDFLAGKKQFTAGAAAGAVRNEGAIATPSGGQVYLIAPNVDNSGVITSPQGEVVLAAGRSVQLVDSRNPELHVVVSAPADKAVNLGQVVAQGGRIGIYGALVNQRGGVSANSAVVGQDGKIVFKASGDTILEQGSTTSATGAGVGGSVQVLGQRVALTGNAAIDASGRQGGGSVLVGGDYQGANAAVQNASQTHIGADASIKADAIDSGSGGRVIAWADDATRFHGAISARGATGAGGFVETSGKNALEAIGRVDVASLKGANGEWLLDPGTIRVVGFDDIGKLLLSGDLFEGLHDGSLVWNSSINNALTSGANLKIQTTGSDVIGISVEAPINAAGAASLKLRTKGNISFAGDGRISSGAFALKVDLLAGTSGGSNDDGGTNDSAVTMAPGTWIKTGGADLNVVAKGNVTLAGIDTTGGSGLGTVSISTKGGDIMQAGLPSPATADAWKVKGELTLDASSGSTGGQINVSNAGNALSGVVTIKTAGSGSNVAVTTSGALALNKVDVGGDLTLLAGNGIGQNGITSSYALQSGDSSTNIVLDGGAGAVVMNNPNNDFGGAVSARTNTSSAYVTLFNANNLHLGEVNTPGALTIQSNGITQTATGLTLGAGSSFTVGTGNIDLTTSGNNTFAQAVRVVNSGTGSTKIKAAGAMDISSIDVLGDLELTASGMTQTGAIKVAGATVLNGGSAPITLENAGNDFQGNFKAVNAGAFDIAVTDFNSLVLDGVTTERDFYLTTNGAVTQATPIRVGRVTDINAGSSAVTLNLDNHLFSDVRIRNNASGVSTSAISLLNSVALSVDSIDTGGNLTATAPSIDSAGTGVKVGGSATLTTTGADGLKLRGGDNFIGGTLTATAADDTNIYLGNFYSGGSLKLGAVTATGGAVDVYAQTVKVNGTVAAKDIAVYGDGEILLASAGKLLGTHSATINVTNSAASIITNGGEITAPTIALSAPKMALLGGTINASTKATLFSPNGFALGGPDTDNRAVLELSNAELDTISAFNLDLLTYSEVPALAPSLTSTLSGITIEGPVTIASGKLGNRLTMTATGDITIGGHLDAAGRQVTLASALGAIKQGSGGELEAAGLTLLASEGIGATGSGKALQTRTGSLWATNNGTDGSIVIANNGTAAGGLAVNLAVQSDGENTGDIAIVNNGSILAGTVLATNGVINLTTQGAAATSHLTVGDVESYSRVTLDSAGAIYMGSSGSVIAPEVGITARGGVGMDNDALRTQTASLQVSNTQTGNAPIRIVNNDLEAAPLDITGVTQTGGGYVDIQNKGATTVSGTVSTDTGSISLVAHSPLTVAIGGVVRSTGGGTIHLEAGSNGSADDKLTVNGTVATTGGVTLEAGDAVVIGSGAVVPTGAAVTQNRNSVSAPSLSDCIANPLLSGCTSVLPSVSTCIGDKTIAGCSVVLPTFSACLADKTIAGCSVVLPSVSTCIGDKTINGCSVVLPTLSACIGDSTLSGCSVVLPAFNACLADKTIAGCSVVLPSISTCIGDKTISGCSVVLPTFSACLADKTVAGCSVVLPSISTCIGDKTVSGCSVVLPTISACIGNKAITGCSVVLPTLTACIGDKTINGCSVVLPTLSECIGAPTTAGCSVVLPSTSVCTEAPNTAGCPIVQPPPAPTLDACIAAPSTAGCSDVLPTVPACVANPSAAGCKAVLPPLDTCVSNPSAAGCTAVLPSLPTCTATPTAPGCAAVLPPLSVCVATPSAPGCAVVLPSMSTCTANPAAAGCSAVLPTLDVCASAPATAGCSAVLPSVDACTINPKAAGCSAVLPSIDACTLNPKAAGCSAVLPTLDVCALNPKAPGCSAVLPSLDACTLNPKAPGCAAVLPTIDACTLNPKTAGCSAVLPSIDACTLKPATAGCGAVLPNITACVANPTAAGCTAVLPNISVCATAPTTNGCSVVLPSVAACTTNPAAIGCSAVLPNLLTCTTAPTTAGCTAVLPALAVCAATPATPGCSAVLPSIASCTAKPDQTGCSSVLPSFSTCLSTPAAAGCSAVLPTLAACTGSPTTNGCSAVLPTLGACSANPSQAGCSAVLPTLSTCVGNPGATGCSAVLPALAQCTATPTAAGCSVVLPSLSSCTSAPATAGCSAVLPSLSSCTSAPATAGCSAVLPPVDACIANPSAPGCVVVLPPTQGPSTEPVAQAVNTTVNVINTITTTKVTTPSPFSSTATTVRPASPAPAAASTPATPSAPAAGSSTPAAATPPAAPAPAAGESSSGSSAGPAPAAGGDKPADKAEDKKADTKDKSEAKASEEKKSEPVKKKMYCN